MHNALLRLAFGQGRPVRSQPVGPPPEGQRVVVVRLRPRLPQKVHALLLLALLAWPLLIAGPMAARAEERQLKREILALYDSRFEAQQHTRIHKFAEMPLNHLGYSLIYWDIERGLPDIRSIERYRGVLTWFERGVAKPEVYLPWAAEVVDRGLRMVIIGDIGAPMEPKYIDGINGVLGDIGLKHAGRFIEVPFAAQVLVKDATMIEFERKLDPVVRGFSLITAEAQDVIAHLTLATSRGARAQSSVLVATSPRGGIIADDFATYYEPVQDRVSWIVNPFVFFKQAFGAERAPIPDVTTLAGQRIYFSHIDGDGWNNVSQVERYAKAGVLSSEVVLKELIEPFPDLPVSVGLIAGDVDPELGGDPTARPIARRLFAMPQVEVASHTHTHPYNWQYFETYKRDDEIKLIEGQQRVERRLYQRAIGTIMKLAHKEKPHQIHERYIAGSAEMPRSYMRRPYELDLEVEGALRAAEQLAPTGKRALLYLWSGDTTPYEAAIRATREAGVRNLNGGDSRYDMEYPSVAYIPPIGRTVGAERQIYSVNSNENTYTNDWTGPFYGFRKLEETVRNTGSPRRLKPFNVYYHMYSGEKPAALEAVRHHLSVARSGPFIPVSASHYAAIADSFFDVEIRSLDDQRWRVSRRGDLQTVRFDEADDVSVDLTKSVGVLGESRALGALFVALDPEVEEAIVALKPAAAVPSASQKPAIGPNAQSPGAKTAAAKTGEANPVDSKTSDGPLSALIPGSEPSVDKAQKDGAKSEAPQSDRSQSDGTRAVAGGQGDNASTAKPAAGSGALVSLTESRWRISELNRGACGFTATAEGFGAGRMVWDGIAPGKYVLTAKRTGKSLWQQDFVVDDQRRLSAVVQADALNPLMIELTCGPAG